MFALPAHDSRGLTVTSVGEERRFNPSLGGEIAQADFTDYMKNLRLAHPKKMAVAVPAPANLKCDRPETDPDLAADPSWAPLKYTFAGIWEIDPHRLEEHAQGVQIPDIREPREFDGLLGHIPDARLIPLGGACRARRRARARPSDRRGVPRRSRSAQATLILREAGFGRCRQSCRRDAALAR